MITIQGHATAMTDVCTHTQGLLDPRTTFRAILACVVRFHRNDRDVVQEGIVFEPLHEYSPSCIMDRLGKLTVANHIADLKMFIGNQVARRDKRVCLLSGKIFTLPLHLQMLLGKCFSSFLSVSRFLLFLGKSSLETFQALFSFVIVTGNVSMCCFLLPTRRSRPIPQPSVKVICLPSSSSFHPVVLYSTLRLSC